jgi:DNA-binding MarR family transcriptional regulator
VEETPVQEPVTAEAAAIEAELVSIVRMLEVLIRVGSTAYDALDRASYLTARVLVNSGPVSIQELAALLWLEPATVARLIRRMEERRLIVRSGGESDKRVSIVELSDDGRGRMELTRQARHNNFREITADWSTEEISDFGRLLGAFNQSQVEHAAGRFSPPRNAGDEE